MGKSKRLGIFYYLVFIYLRLGRYIIKGAKRTLHRCLAIVPYKVSNEPFLFFLLKYN